MTGLERATQMIGSKAVRLPLLLFCLLLLVRPAAATPRIFWEKTGEKRIFEGGAQKIRHLFRFRNEGDSQLRIERVRRTCGSCSVFNLSRKTLAPGAEAQLEIEVAFGPGETVKKTYVYIESNDPANPFFQIALESEAPGINYPAQVFFENVPAHTPAARSIEIFAVGERGFGIREIRTGPLVESVRADTIKENRRYRLEIRLKPRPPVKFGQDYVKIRTDYPGLEEIEIRLYASMVSSAGGVSGEGRPRDPEAPDPKRDRRR
ncbi:MAG TPA: DUF1573 domain-containing protein [bacterium]|nr:DUF1573 domain-containing protein [bacterium]HNS48012.1 DUF1573 domain-containing protein [bacterium]